MSAVEDLREAARLMRERAEAATPGPWEHVDHGPPAGAFKGCGQVITWGAGVEGGDIAGPTGDLYPRSGYSPLDDMAWIASMHPLVGLALAQALEDHATDSYEGHAPSMQGFIAGDDGGLKDPMIVLARLYLGRPE